MSLIFRLLAAILLVLPAQALACTAFCAAAKGRVLAGNNEDLFQKYRFPWVERSVLMFADASGDAAILDGETILRKLGRTLVQTNFRQSTAKPGEVPCERSRIATRMLESAGENIDIGLFRRILAATHQEGDNPTQYSTTITKTSSLWIWSGNCAKERIPWRSLRCFRARMPPKRGPPGTRTRSRS